MKRQAAWLLVALSFLAWGCSRSTSDPLVVGMELAYPPFEMTNEQGEPAGVSVALARALAEALGRPLVIENTSFDGLIPALKTGRIHLIISSMTATDERRESIDFSDPYLTTGLAVLAGVAVPVATIDDLNQPGRRVAVKLGTTGELFARDSLPHAEIIVLKEESACVLEVIQGRADAFLYDQMSVFQHARRNPETTRALLAPFKVESWAIGLRKGDHALGDAVNAFLRDFRGRGGFDELADRYLREMKDAFTAAGVSFVF
jgi:polar amino acid transport system substrate-binding protein